MFKLRDYQQEAIDAIYEHFTHYTTNPIVSAPTGSGKSIIIAEFTRTSGARVLIMSHVREIIEQNYEALNMTDKGIFCAALKRRDTKQKVVFASIQSIANKIHTFAPFDLVIVDEVHRVPNKKMGQYRAVIDTLLMMNPKTKVIGFSATPFRLDGGLLTNGDLFSRICYDIPILRLIEDEHLCPLTTRGSEHKIDTTNIKVSRGEYLLAQLEQSILKGHVTEQALSEVIRMDMSRKAWLIFCVGVEHVKLATSFLNSQNIKTKALTGKTPKDERTKIIEDFKANRIKALVNCNVLTTGFNAPITDNIVMLRPTKSTSLYLQMLGRGMRTYPGKIDCAVRDFAGNIVEHGPIDEISIQKTVSKDGKLIDTIKTTPCRECPTCHLFVPARERECKECGYVFPPPIIQHDTKASTADILSSNGLKEVQKVTYKLHTKNGKESMRVNYVTKLRSYHEFVLLGYPNHIHRAQRWWMKRSKEQLTPPTTVSEALLRTDELKTPIAIKTRKNGKYYEVIGMVW